MVRRLVVAVAVLVLAACGGDGGRDGGRDGEDGPATTATTAPASTMSTAVVPVGFDAVALTVTTADGVVCELCVWRAATVAERRQGLMGVTDLGGLDGMVFVYDAPVENRFWMRDTPMTLDIAWFGADRVLVSTATMTPCLTGTDASCPRYPAAAPFVIALEVPVGRLAELGIGPGSSAELGAGTGCDTA